MGSTPWFLESVAADGARVTHRIDRLPFSVGRDQGNDLTIEAQGLSRRHAELQADEVGGLLVVDLGSTNGTFVNHERLAGPRQLAPNDIIHFCTAEFRLTHDETLAAATVSEPRPMRTMVVPGTNPLSQNFVRQEAQFLEFLGGRGLTAAAQPIVDARTGRLLAYELLGRSTHPDLPGSPMHLFMMAATLRREAELSEAFRSYGVRALAPKAQGVHVFVNAHPSETFSEAFFQSLHTLLALPERPKLVVEVHESAVVEVERMRELAERLKGIGVAFAYDDFGAGQARLNELAEVPAHFVKFDMGIVRNLHEASERKQRMVRDLVRMVLELGSIPLAEGVEQEAEAEICRDMGFRLIQGYLTGKPVMVDKL
ncbi:EAL domain-containing protein (putative c-di-GMP-specific phosphodiesterase class I) [Pelomonas saccharophila]|uniref:EAL domain-containing protein (Putative c-di-GMP-specific phosphodiesterase class I) n=1 Tax=Roseateles saccharophilus TaxID=304 RepID=A0ABU1YI00_ROSSA|nr:EAL domain-containing protein [Roseateles saccharophilus]MDR7268477.1 EAL domain-containing protein (putative c-di-GMP-specific phosphodiesterase class I) [Roseateles saccharophilus]